MEPTLYNSQIRRFVFLFIVLCSPYAVADFTDKSADPNVLPKVPPEFEVSLFAQDPLVRQPCSMAFDEKGRLFVGMGPQYRNPKPETPGDRVMIVLDNDGDGKADTTKTFATGFNAIQGLAWHGSELWIANAPDLTVVRDVDGDDTADEYVKLYTDLGNLEHGLHGLNWAPDGKLYMSKGNSKGLNQPDRYAPKPFRDLWGLTAPPSVPDFPAPKVFTKDDYRHSYHHPADDWGMDGGVLRCDSDGSNLEIIARGFRNPWDITLDDGFNWLGTDNDQNQGDRVFMPFYGAHFGWNHPWSSHWSSKPHAPTAPVSGPLFEGSGTGVTYCMSKQFPPEYRGAFLVNDWLLKKTYLWRPEWDGAMLRPEGGGFTTLIDGGESLFRPTDLEFGPDGALWVLGWSSGYGAEYDSGELSNEGRIFRISWKEAPKVEPIQTKLSLKEHTVEELINDFDSPLPVHRINAQDELVNRDGEVIQEVMQRISEGSLTQNQETWSLWTLGRMGKATLLADYLYHTLHSKTQDGLNQKIQAVRIFAFRSKQFQQTKWLQEAMRIALRHAQPRVRFAAVQAIHEASLRELTPELLQALEKENDSTVLYSGWQALKSLSSTADRRSLLSDPRKTIRRAALLSLLENQEMNHEEVKRILDAEEDSDVRSVANLWSEKMKQATGPAIKGRSLSEASGIPQTESSASPIATIRKVRTEGKRKYRIVPGGFIKGNKTYVDRTYRLTTVPPPLLGNDLIQTANSDESSRGDKWLTAEAVIPIRVHVGIDEEQEVPPSWLTKNFKKEDFTASIDEGATLVFYSRDFDEGTFTLGGNTQDGDAGSMVNYLVAIGPQPLKQNQTQTTVSAALEQLALGNADRGEILFRHSLGAGCAKCHSLDDSRNGFGPSLRNIGSRSNARHIAQSIVAPSEVITEGFNQQSIITDEGKVYSGVLLEESGLSISLGQSTGQRIDIPKSSIEARKSNPISAMPDLSKTLTPMQVADLTAFLLSMKEPAEEDLASTASGSASKDASRTGFRVDKKKNKLLISLSNKQIVEFVFRDDHTLRPFFANASLINGLKVTRNHPPIKGIDQLDHSELHPGIWLAFGDINGEDYWRNKASMEHVRFISEPTISNEKLSFSTECRLRKSNGEPLCLLTNHYTLTARPSGWLLVWEAKFQADKETVTLGDQEEMGFGARIATAFTEKNGGRIRSSSGKQSAEQTWGQPAEWCDYSGAEPDSGGIMLMADPNNFRKSWWHNRNYGAFVSNPFGRKAMKQGDTSSVVIEAGESMSLTFGAMIHDHRSFDADAEYRVFRDSLKK